MHLVSINTLYYISKLVRKLRLVNLADRTLLHELRKFNFLLLPNCCMIYHQSFSTYEANNSLKLSSTLNCVLKHANDDFKLTRFAFNQVQKFEAVPHEWKSFPNPSDTQQRYNKHITNLVFSVRTVSYESSVMAQART